MSVSEATQRDSALKTQKYTQLCGHSLETQYKALTLNDMPDWTATLENVLGSSIVSSRSLPKYSKSL